MTRPEWVEAGARAYVESARAGWTYEQSIAAVISAVEPLIRADERERMSLLDDYDPVPGLIARGVMSDDHDPESCEADCCFAEAVCAARFPTWNDMMDPLTKKGARRQAEFWLETTEPLIRADERERAHVHATGTSSGDGPCCQCCYDVYAAEAVAARLVEVICVDEFLLDNAYRYRLQAEMERDNLRAQIADRLAEQERLSAAAYARDGGSYNEGCRDAFDVAEQIARGEKGASDG